ncbi:hypothetical protein [Luethyella okanaganae]|uniref:Uncharacterized protein n=1 Tax=Luethyella okanaganae TaxID=69372 RepID=A0ABW1VKQ4_9MICO
MTVEAIFAARTLALFAASVALLVGCSQNATPTDGAVDQPSAAGGGGAASCDAATAEGYELFSDPALSVHPEDGVEFGGGTAMSFTYELHDETRSPTRRAPRRTPTTWPSSRMTVASRR